MAGGTKNMPGYIIVGNMAKLELLAIGTGAGD